MNSLFGKERAWISGDKWYWRCQRICYCRYSCGSYVSPFSFFFRVYEFFIYAFTWKWNSEVQDPFSERGTTSFHHCSHDQSTLTFQTLTTEDQMLNFQHGKEVYAYTWNEIRKWWNEVVPRSENGSCTSEFLSMCRHTLFFHAGNSAFGLPSLVFERSASIGRASNGGTNGSNFTIAALSSLHLACGNITFKCW